MSQRAEGDGWVSYSRETLYEEVWAEPVKVVAQRYGISDVALAKTCRKLGVPLPGRGYWAKHKAGSALARPPLGELPAGARGEIQVSQWCRTQAGVRLVAPKEEGLPSRIHVPVPDELTKPHRLVRDARDLLRGPGSRKEFVACRDRACLDIAVSRGSLGRALRIADALVKALEGQGYEVGVTEPRRTFAYYGSSSLVPGVTRVLVDEDWITFSLAEKEAIVKETRTDRWGYDSTHWDHVPTGALSLVISNVPGGLRRSWNDGKEQRVEDCLGQFIAYLPLVSEKLREERLEAERRHQEWLEQERRRQEEEARRLEEKARQEELLEALKRWRLAKDIRAFLAEASEALSMRRHQNEAAAAIEQRLGWAREYAEVLDPVAEYVGLGATQDDQQ